jgi:hypothetical protein
MVCSVRAQHVESLDNILSLSLKILFSTPPPSLSPGQMDGSFRHDKGNQDIF